jgi:hypothetical protein
LLPAVRTELIASVEKPTLCVSLQHYRQRRIIIHHYETQKLLRRTQQSGAGSHAEMPRDGEGAAYVDQGNLLFDRLLLTAPSFASSSTRSATKSYKIDTAKSVKFVALRESVPGTFRNCRSRCD